MLKIRKQPASIMCPIVAKQLKRFPIKFKSPRQLLIDHGGPEKMADMLVGACTSAAALV